MIPLKVAILAAFLHYRQVLVLSQRQELVPIAVMDKNTAGPPNIGHFRFVQ